MYSEVLCGPQLAVWDADVSRTSSFEFRWRWKFREQVFKLMYPEFEEHTEIFETRHPTALSLSLSFSLSLNCQSSKCLFVSRLFTQTNQWKALDPFTVCVCVTTVMELSQVFFFCFWCIKCTDVVLPDALLACGWVCDWDIKGETVRAECMSSSYTENNSLIVPACAATVCPVRLRSETICLIHWTWAFSSLEKIHTCKMVTATGVRLNEWKLTCGVKHFESSSY